MYNAQSRYAKKTIRNPVIKLNDVNTKLETKYIGPYMNHIHKSRFIKYKFVPDVPIGLLKYRYRYRQDQNPGKSIKH